MAGATLQHADRHVKPVSDAVFTDLDDGTGVLMNLKTKYYFQLNPTGARMWKHLEKQKRIKVQDFFEAMREMYDADPDVLAGDINEYLSNLHREGMIELS